MSEETVESPSRAENSSTVGQNGAETQIPMGINKPAKKLKAKPLKEVLNKILPQLQRRDLYQFFAMPVPSVEVPEYYSVIKNPMDFSTMEQKLAEGEYKSVDVFKVSCRRHSFLCVCNVY
jgi:hypothetical protein